MTERWATFDCYGTLIDWNAGIGGVLGSIFGEPQRDALLARYHQLEPAVEAPGAIRYRDVLRLVLEQIALEHRVHLAPEQADGLAQSLPEWPVFPEVPGALAELRRRGWRLAILSNTDHDLIEASKRRIGVPVDLTIVAEEVGSYKPDHGHWERFFERSGADRSRMVHVAASLFHDVVPASELGLPIVWVNRLGERATAEPTREIPDLAPLPDVVDELVPAAGGAAVAGT